MASLIDTASTTSTDIPALASGDERKHDHATTSAGSNGSVAKSKHVVSRSSFQHAIAIHSRAKTSCLTQGSEPIPSYDGFRNLMILVILVSNLRLMIENFRKYGVLICVRCHDYRRQDILYGTILFFLVPCHLFVAYVIELAAAQQAKGAVGRVKKSEPKEHKQDQVESEKHSIRSKWHVVALAHGINATLNLVIATIVVYYYIYHPGIGTLCEMHAVIVWLKVCSYAFTNRDLRQAALSPSLSSSLPDIYSSCPYPRNITLRNLSYFWWAPTLIYQPVYPRTTHIRWDFVLKRAGEVACLSVAIWIASAQYAVPLLHNSLPTISSLDIPSILERLMKLSSISLFCWLAGFFALFQSFLNLLAEIMTFADREFYQDWWNTSSIRGYWSSWNRPVYQFMKRHLYLPLVGRGYPPQIAQLIVFVFSGVLHEILVGIPTHNVIGVAFAGMMFQIPLIILTDVLTKIKGFGGKTAGNIIFWVSFVLVGQPLAALLYFFAWHAKYGSVSTPHLNLHWRGEQHSPLGKVTKS